MVDSRKNPSSQDRIISAANGFSSIDVSTNTSPSDKTVFARVNSSSERTILRKSIMPEICPTITASNAHTFRQQIERIAPFARRVHIDLMDGVFAPRKSLKPSEIWWPVGMKADIHLMFKDPSKHIDSVIDLKPQLIIVHAEAEGNFFELAQRIKHAKISVGVALLKQTPVSEIEPALLIIEHVLVFSGNLGYQGGSRAELELLTKVKAIRNLKPDLEIGWDGGITEHNIGQLADGGVDVLNVGGYIQHSNDPMSAYQSLAKTIQ